MNIAIFGFGFLYACFPVALDQDTHEIQSRRFGLPILADARVKERCASFRIWISEDRGKVWKHQAEVQPTVTELVYIAPRDGHYWFRLQSKLKDGTLDPLKIDELTDTKKVYVNTHRFPVVQPVIAARPPLSQPPAGQQPDLHQLQREVRELRAIVETLRKKTAELEKDRKSK